MAAFLSRSEILKSLLYYTTKHAPLKLNLGVFKQTFPSLWQRGRACYLALGYKGYASGGQGKQGIEAGYRKHVGTSRTPLVTQGPAEAQSALSPLLLHEVNAHRGVGMEPRPEE